MSNTFEKLISLSKRRGIIFPSSEIYGGLSATYDYGPLGIELKKECTGQLVAVHGVPA